jgi:hypothetical protein
MGEEGISFRDHGMTNLLMRVVENKEQVAPKVEMLRGIHPLGLGWNEKPSKSTKKESWCKMTM